MAQTVGYARVSTSRQTTAQQVDALRAAGCEPIFTEAMSGKIAERPELTAALASLGPGDRLVVWKLDRLGRDTAQVLSTIKDLRDRDIVVQSLTDGMDSSTPTGRMMLGVLASVAEFETELRAERAAAKRALMRKRGQSVGGRPRRFDADGAAAIRRAHANGETIVDLAKLHGVSRPTIYRILEGQR